uniref:BTB domain-containing protein n=1 Tax=Arion vulgaris TaxID=1028688 RepID=A0A0B7AN37_9EUPU
MSVDCFNAPMSDTNNEQQDSLLSTENELNTSDTKRSQKLLDVAFQSWKAGLYTDVTIVVGEQRLSAHRIVLASLSDYFPPLLKLDAKESGEVTLHNIQPDDFSILLNYAYTGEVDITKENVQNILIASDYLNIKHVKDMCIKFMTANYACDDVCDVLEFAMEYPLSDLTESALQFLKENLDNVSKTESFMQLKPTFLEKFFDDDNLVLYSSKISLKSAKREELIFTAVLRYLSKSPNSSSEVINAMMKTVRMTQLPKDAAMNCLENFKTLKDNEIIKKYVRLRDVAVKFVQQSKERGSGYRNTQGIPESWFRSRKYATFSFFQRDVRYAAGGEIEPSPEPPNFLYNDCNLEIKRIEIWLRRWDTRLVIGGLSLSYRSASDDNRILEYRRGSCPGPHGQHIVELEPDEFIIKVVLGSGYLIDRLGFETSRGRVFGPFGGPGGSDRTELAPSGALSYLFDINCDSVITQGSEAIFNLMFRWITFE